MVPILSNAESAISGVFFCDNYPILLTLCSSRVFKKSNPFSCLGNHERR